MNFTRLPVLSSNPTHRKHLGFLPWPGDDQGPSPIGYFAVLPKLNLRPGVAAARVPPIVKHRLECDFDPSGMFFYIRWPFDLAPELLPKFQGYGERS